MRQHGNDYSISRTCISIFQQQMITVCIYSRPRLMHIEHLLDLHTSLEPRTFERIEDIYDHCLNNVSCDRCYNSVSAEIDRCTDDIQQAKKMAWFAAGSILRTTDYSIDPLDEETRLWAVSLHKRHGASWVFKYTTDVSPILAERARIILSLLGR